MKGHKLEFLSYIKRDGSGVVKVGDEWFPGIGHPKTDDMSYLNEDKFKLTRLSLSLGTFIASGFNSWVVKLKK